MPKLNTREKMILCLATGLFLGTSWVTFGGGVGILIMMFILKDK